MPQEILVNISSREIRIALLENTILQEVHIERRLHEGLLGNIYKGRAGRLLPGIQASFVDIGFDRSAFLHVSDMGVETDAKTDIRKHLTQGREILVQVYKDPLGSKGARLTTQFTIPSRYLVFTPNVFQISVSQKITDEAERERLQSLITPGKKGGYIFRTVAENISQTEILADKEYLDALWETIDAKCQSVKAPGLVYEEIPIVLRVLRDLVGFDVARIQVDDPGVVQTMQAFAERYMPGLLNRIEFYNGERPIFDMFGVETELQKALERKIPLKSGGHLIFDQTEAMTTIDVNTGSYTGHLNLEDTIVKTNIESIEIIAHQIRLRNLGGIIIIDFIDMTDPAHKENMLQLLTQALTKDSAKTQISELSSLGLVQMTRKRTRESLEHVLCVTCPLCQRRGSIKSLETICCDIFRELQRAAKIYPWQGFVISASPEVTDELKNKELQTLAELEIQLGKPIKLHPETYYVRERFDILPLSEKE
jgi:ribonuclease G